MIVILEGEGEVVEFVDSVVCGVLGVVEGCFLDGLVREEMDEGSLFCGEGFVVFL